MFGGAPPRMLNSVVEESQLKITTETQRTQRLHRRVQIRSPRDFGGGVSARCLVVCSVTLTGIASVKSASSNSFAVDADLNAVSVGPALISLSGVLRFHWFLSIKVLISV